MRERAGWSCALVLAALAGCRASAHAVLLDGPGFDARADGCGGYFADARGHGSFRTASCETVAVFWDDAACEKFGRECSDALRELDARGDAGFLDGFGPMERIAGHAGLYRVRNGYIRVRDEAKFRSEFRAFAPTEELIARLLRFEVHGEEWRASVKHLAGTMPFQAAVTKALAAKLAALSGYTIGDRVIADFWHVAELLALSYAAEVAQVDSHERDVARHFDRLAQSYGDLAYYLKKWRDDPDAIDFIRESRAYVEQGFPSSLRATDPGLAGFGTYLHRALGGLVERDIAQDLLALAKRQEEAGRPATAEVLRIYAQLHTPVRVRGADRASISLCRSEASARFLWTSSQHLTHIDYRLPLEGPIIEVEAPAIATRREVRKVGQRTVTYVIAEAGPGLSPEQQREADLLRVQIANLERERAAYYAPSTRTSVDLSTPTRPAVTGWECNAVNTRCGPTYQVGTAPTSTRSPGTVSNRPLWPFPREKEIEALRKQLERVAPAELTREAKYGERTEDVKRAVSLYQARYTLTISGFGAQESVSNLGGWHEDRDVARADAICNAVVDAARHSLAFTERALQQRLVEAKAKANLADALDQRATKLTGVSRDHLAAFLGEVIADTPPLRPAWWVFSIRHASSEKPASYAKYLDAARMRLDMDPEHWIDWSQGSWSLGYGAATGQLQEQGAMGALAISFKRADDEGAGWYVGGRVEHGFESYADTFGGMLRAGVAGLSESARRQYGLGLVGGYAQAGADKLYVAGLELGLAWRMFRQVSLNATVSWNALSLTDLAKETPIVSMDPDVDPGAYVITATPHPMSLHLHWLMPSQFYLQTGIRRDFSGELNASAFIELGRTWGFRRR